jgi:hypothetical protein
MKINSMLSVLILIGLQNSLPQFVFASGVVSPREVRIAPHEISVEAHDGRAYKNTLVIHLSSNRKDDLTIQYFDYEKAKSAKRFIEMLVHRAETIQKDVIVDLAILELAEHDEDDIAITTNHENLGFTIAPQKSTVDITEAFRISP